MIAKADTVVEDITVLEHQTKVLAGDISKVNDRLVLVRNEPEQKAKWANDLIIRGLIEVADKSDLYTAKAIFQDLGIEIDDVA